MSWFSVFLSEFSRASALRGNFNTKEEEEEKKEKKKKSLSAFSTASSFEREES